MTTEELKEANSKLFMDILIMEQSKGLEDVLAIAQSLAQSLTPA